MTLWTYLRTHVRMATVVVGSAVLLAASVLAAGYNERQYHAETLRAARVQAEILASTATAALAFDDRAAAREYVGALHANPDVEAAGVFDEHGRLVASYGSSHIATELSRTIRPSPTAGRIAVIAPVMQDGSRLGAVYLRERIESPLGRLRHYAGAALLVLMTLLMVCLVELDARALARSNRELTVQMAERERAEAALRQSQKMEAVGRLTGGVAHDFNNMLSVVLGSLDILQRRYGDADPKLLRLVENAVEGAKRAAALTQRLLAFSRRQPLAPAPTDVAKTVQDISDLLRRTLGEGITIETVISGGLWRAHIDRPQLESAIVNLAINARDAMPNGGRLTIETGNAYLDHSYATANAEVAPGQYVMVAVTDTGSGMSPEVMAQVFEPFFTTKPPGVGTGLGLSQVQGFIKQSGGHVALYSEPGVGTTVKLYLPRSHAEPEAAEAAPARSALTARREVTVLLVDDEAGVREFAREALLELGYDVLAAESAAAAHVLMAAHPEIAILLTDVVMPETNGRSLAEAALRRRPQLRVLYMTGYTQNAIVHNGVLDRGAYLLTKPFTVSQLDLALESLQR